MLFVREEFSQLGNLFSKFSYLNTNKLSILNSEWNNISHSNWYVKSTHSNWYVKSYTCWMYTAWQIWPYACSLLWETAWLLFRVARLFYIPASILYLSFLLFSPSGWFKIPSFITSVCMEDSLLMFPMGNSVGDKFFYISFLCECLNSSSFPRGNNLCMKGLISLTFLTEMPEIAETSVGNHTLTMNNPTLEENHEEEDTFNPPVFHNFSESEMISITNSTP